MAQITGSKALGLKVIDWHGGQFTPSYMVGSSFVAGYTVNSETVQAAIDELRHLWGLRPEAQGYNNRQLKSIIKSLEGLL